MMPFGPASFLSTLAGLTYAARSDSAAARDRKTLALENVGQVVYAIGDVHGCLAQLLKLEARIAISAQQSPEREHVVIMLGDVIDRGADSAEIIDHLRMPPKAPFRRIVLAGNHEEAMLAAFDNTSRLARWLEFGGRETLDSYGIPDIARLPSRTDLQRLRRTMDFLVPEDHRCWLAGLPKAVSWRNYLFVHAGIRPGVPLASQSLKDMTEIREPFLSSSLDFGAVVVHGHTPTEVPQRFDNRIALDTGCYLTGRLTAARFLDDSVSFLTVS
ncbi:metallophosphoesterase [Kaistia dalseonensis]|uniref:Serine/threonine protein phosphatase 1 n=1 Tax=Kaistia dalseonensis TaxID=410840 RepID=A0ABU0H320_9HYPH|nr:metallophosphoesterase [Kaistia dalseonensis]MCX5494123.1 metallophosphoesterase [Kaistia dalseonensis]MDQ0436702.1 serine/threonine protein phosphatase 1 [Kaistia dalseonensis]